MAHRMRKKAVQQGRSERRSEAYSAPYVEPLSDARTPLADFFRILLARRVGNLGKSAISALEQTVAQRLLPPSLQPVPGDACVTVG